MENKECSKPPTSYGNPHLGFWKKGVQPPFSLDLLTGTCWEIPKFTSAKKAQRPAMELMTEGKSPAVFGLYSYDVPMMFPLYHIKSHPFLLGISVYPFFCPITNQWNSWFSHSASLWYPKNTTPKTHPGSELPHLTQLLASHVRLGRWCFHQLGKWLTGNIWKPPRKVRKVPWLKHRESAWQLEQPSSENSKLQWIDFKNGTFPGNLRNHQIHVPGFPLSVWEAVPLNPSLRASLELHSPIQSPQQILFGFVWN